MASHMTKVKVTSSHRKMIMPEWKKVTPQAKEILASLQNKETAKKFRTKNSKKLDRLPAQASLAIIPSIIKWPLIERWYCKIICSPRYRVRKNQKNLTATEWARFVGAVKGVMVSGAQSPTYQEFVDVHVAAMTTNMGWGAHGNNNFLPWHREYLMEFENRLRIFNPLVTIPYWNWVEERIIPSQLADPDDLLEWGVTRSSPFSEPLPTQTELGNVMAQTNYSNFRSALEGGPHNKVHRAVGGNMSRAESPSDPLFWLHHAFVDKIWADWQKINVSNPTNTSDTLQPTPLFQRTVGQTFSTTTMGYVYI
jgi:tyrosinase